MGRRALKERNSLGRRVGHRATQDSVEPEPLTARPPLMNTNSMHTGVQVDMLHDTFKR